MAMLTMFRNFPSLFCLSSLGSMLDWSSLVFVSLLLFSCDTIEFFPRLEIVTSI